MSAVLRSYATSLAVTPGDRGGLVQPGRETIVMKSARIYLASLLALSLFPSVASATCGTGNPSSYDDITAVMLTGEPYGHFIRRCSGTSPCFNNPTTLAGSWFWALFGSAPDYQTTTFTDYD